MVKNFFSKIKKIAKRFNLALILIFGSAVSKKIHPNSDVDIAILPKKELNFQKISDLQFEFQKLFPENEVDLVFLSKIDPLLLKKIFENCKKLYGSERVFKEFEIYAFHRHCDYRKFFQLEEKFVKNALK